MRAFLSLTPAPRSALDIEQSSARCWPGIDRRVPAGNLHITLAFLGDIDHSTNIRITEMLAEPLPVEEFSTVFDKVGYWSQPQVLWLGSHQPDESLALLAGYCRQIANKAGIRVSNKNYEPHITIARKPVMPPQAPLIDPAFCMAFDSVQLYESILDRRGARYVVRDEWPLCRSPE